MIMAVNNIKGSSNPVPAGSLGALDAGKTEKTAPKAVAQAYAKQSSAPSVKDAANVQISQKAKDISMAKKAAHEAPDVREDKVAYYKNKIAKGEYKPDAGNIADGILREAMKDEIAKNPGIIMKQN